MREEKDAKKDVISGEEVWSVISAAETVYVASGSKLLKYAPGGGGKRRTDDKGNGPDR